MASRIIFAADNMTLAAASDFSRNLRGLIWGVKTNDLMFGEHSVPEVIGLIGRYGHVFADPKLHDIPKTVGNETKRFAQAGAHLLTVHASGGVAMIRAAVEAYEANKPAGGLGILTVTLLTSLNEQECLEIYGDGPEVVVPRFAAYAENAGAYGIVCSAKELSLLRGRFRRLVRVVPGTRSPGAETHDQARVDTQENAIKNGADFLVMGREIAESPEPAAVCERVNALG